MKFLAAIAAMLLPVVAMAQPKPPAFNPATPYTWPAPQTFTKGLVRPSTVCDAVAFSSGGVGVGNGCTWDSSHDVGPCINAALAAVNCGVVQLPGGVYGLATTIQNRTSCVGLRGVQGAFSSGISVTAGTHLLWIGASAGGPMLDMESPGGASGTVSLFSMDVEQILFDGNNLASVDVKIANVSESRIRLSAANAQTTNIWLTTEPPPYSALPGTQNNFFWLESEAQGSSFCPTGILIDGGTGANTNVSNTSALKR